jgi:hypothetical protein
MGERTTRLRDRLAVRDTLRSELVAAQAERDKRPNFIDTLDGPELEWVVYEQQRMLAAVNVERAKRGLGPVDPAKIAKADRLSSGHVDYTDKFTLYCAELVVTEADDA